MQKLSAYIEGVALTGPGLSDWKQAQAVLRGQLAYQPQPTRLSPPLRLPPAERRRCGAIVKLSLEVGLEAAAHAGREAADLNTVFAAAGADGNNCHEICQMLASDDRQISPTRFHNSVHNAAAGYWGIATGATASASVICAHDASFGAGLLEAMVQLACGQAASLLIACDTPYPEPLHRARPILDAFGVGLVLSARQSTRSLARISAALTAELPDGMQTTELEVLRAAIPAARSLPLLEAVANRACARPVLAYLQGRQLAVDVTPCN